MFDIVFLAPNDKHYFFHGVHYWRYDMQNGSVDPRYPRIIGENWPGVPLNADAAVRGEGRFARKIFFFKKDRVWRYDPSTSTVDAGFPRVTADFWPGFFFGGIDHAVSLPSGDMLFAKGPHVLRYDHAADAIDGTTLLGIDAIARDRGDLGDAVCAGGPHRANMLYVFDGAKYDRLNMGTGARNGNYPRDWDGVWTDLPSPAQSTRLKIAKDRLVAFAENPGPGRWTGVTHPQILTSMAERVMDAAIVNQDTTQFCGPAAIIYWQCENRLTQYLKNCIDIFDKGAFFDFEGGTYEASSNLRAATFADGIAPVDWMYMATLRETENLVAKVDGDGSRIAEGLTTMREMRRYSRKVLNLSNIEDEKSYTFGERKALLLAEEAVKDGGAGFLMIRIEMLNGERTRVPWPTHWVVLLGNTLIDDGRPMRPSDGHYTFDVWTSGWPRLTLDISEKVFKDSMFGAVSARP